jgi:hypothetical protein
VNAENRLVSVNGASDSLPGAEEFRMVRAIALLALLEAARNGEYRATFHGFRIHARRQCPPDADAYVEVNLCVTLGKAIVERGVVATGDSGVREPMR